MKTKHLVIAGLIAAGLMVAYIAYQKHEKRESLMQWHELQNKLDSMDAVQIEIE